MQRRFHAIAIGLGMIPPGQSTSGEKILNFPETDDILALSLEEVEECRAERLEREIATMFSACERSWGSYEWSGNNPSDSVVSCEHLSCNFAHMVQFLKGDYVLMRGKLKNAIGRCVEDRKASTHMLFAQFFDDLCAGSSLVADDFASNGLFQGASPIIAVDMCIWIGARSDAVEDHKNCSFKSRHNCTFVFSSFA